ncbi:MAG: RHS repeat domain-containing protein [Armatimonadota bacterium]
MGQWITSATPPNPIPDQPAGGSYGYDWVGNRLNPPTGSNHMVYNAADQLTSWPGMHGYQYDSAGNLQTVTGSGAASYTYTYAGLMETADFTGRNSDGTYGQRRLINTWDSDSNRVKFEVGHVVGGTYTQDYNHTFVYDPTAGIPAVIQEDGVYYFREPGGSLVARQNTAMHYYHFDNLGNTRLLTDTNGNTTDKYAYDAYGAVLAHERYAGSANQPYQYVGRLGYYADWQEPELSLLQLGVMFYDAEYGQFTQVDPVKRYRYSSYVYADADPTGMVDPSGKRPGDYEECVVKFKKCNEGAFNRFTKCIANSVGVSDMGTGVPKCIIACGLLSKLIPGSYKACCSGCLALLTACTWVDIESCQKVLDSEKSSCESAFDYCKRQANR